MLNHQFQTRICRIVCLGVSVLFLGLPPCLHGQNYDQLFRQHQAELDANRYDEALRLDLEVLQLAEAQRNTREIGRWTSYLGQTYSAMGRFDKAEQFLKRALVFDEKAFGPDHLRVATDLTVLAGLYLY